MPLPLSPAAPLRSTTPPSSRRHAGSALGGGVGAGRSGRGSGLAVDGDLDEHRGVGVRLDQHKRHLLSAGGGQGGEPPTKARSERAHACWGRGVLCVCQHQLRAGPARTAVDPVTNYSSARQRFASRDPPQPCPGPATCKRQLHGRNTTAMHDLHTSKARAHTSSAQPHGHTHGHAARPQARSFGSDSVRAIVRQAPRRDTHTHLDAVGATGCRR